MSSHRKESAAANGYLIAAIDMDGTLLRSDGTVSRRTRESLRRASESGIRLVVVSARPPRIIRDYCEMLDLQGLALCCNGAIVYDPRRHAVVDSVSLDAGRLARKLRREIPEVMLGWESGLAYGCDRGFLLEHHFQGGSERLDPAEAEVHKVLLHHPEVPQAELRQLAEKVIGLSAAVTISGHDVVEVMAPGVSKAAGVARLAAYFGTDLSSVVAFGDMPNDVPLLQQAGRGIAVENAHREVREVADEVTASNDEDGVALVLDQLAEGMLAGRGA